MRRGEEGEVLGYAGSGNPDWRQRVPAGKHDDNTHQASMKGFKMLHATGCVRKYLPNTPMSYDQIWV